MVSVVRNSLIIIMVLNIRAMNIVLIAVLSSLTIFFVLYSVVLHFLS